MTSIKDKNCSGMFSRSDRVMRNFIKSFMIAFSHGLRVLMQRLSRENNLNVNIDARLPRFDDHNSDISDYERLTEGQFEN